MIPENKETFNILILDDEKQVTEELRKFLVKQKMEVSTANTVHEAIALLEKNQIDLLVSDVMLPEMSGIEVLKKVKSDYPGTEVIMISGYGDIDTVINAMRLGAIDFFRKPFSLLDIQLSIERTARFMQLQSRLRRVKDHSSLVSRELEKLTAKEFIGNSMEIKKVRDLAYKAAEDMDVNVLITGENGTGKEIVARIIHFAGERKNHPFYPVNSSAVPEALLESEFFGHGKGAFTGATENRKGCFELADGGTLFLDEIADMPMVLQAKLLRVIEEKKFRPVGTNREVSVDVRLVSATNKHIQSLVDENKFRSDFYHRINTLVIHIPPLRERSEDIQPLLEYFIRFFAVKKSRTIPHICPSLIKELEKYRFPGNVRELKNMTERALILSKGDILNIDDFHMSLKETGKRKTSVKIHNLAMLEKDTICKALIESNYNQTKAALLLGISNDALHRRIVKHKIPLKKVIQE